MSVYKITVKPLCRDKKQSIGSNVRMKNIMRLSQLNVENGITSSDSCRLCLRTVLSSTPIFTEGETFERLRACIRDCCPITLFKDDQLPKMICDDCKKQVATTYEFRERCRETEHKLRSLYDSSYSCAVGLVRVPYQITVQDRSVQTDDQTYYQLTGVSIDSMKEISRINEKKDEEVSRENIETECWLEMRQVEGKGKGKIEESQLTESRGVRLSGTGDGDQFKVGIVKDKSEGKEEKRKRRIKIYVEEYRLPDRKTKAAHVDRRSQSVATKLVGHVSSEPVHCQSEEVAVANRGEDRCYTDQPLNTTDSKIRKRYLCDVCSKTFASKSGLRFHLKLHIGAKPHLCRHCGKGFAIPSYAKRHERIHRSEKLFVCQFCSALFASANGLKYHLRSHTGEANYRCETCGKAFIRGKYLKEHIFTHTGEKPFVCKTCGVAYGNSGSLFAHEKRCKTRGACKSLTTNVN